jgi:hypothetical protein
MEMILTLKEIDIVELEALKAVFDGIENMLNTSRHIKSWMKFMKKSHLATQSPLIYVSIIIRVLI